MGVDHAEPAQREQRQRLHRFARSAPDRRHSPAPAARSGLQAATPSRPQRGKVRVLIRQMAAVDRRADARLEFSRQARGDIADARHRYRCRPVRRSPPRRACGCASARAPNVAIAAASADNGPGAASAARLTALISLAETLSTSAPTRSILPGNSGRRCPPRHPPARRPARSGSPPCRPAAAARAASTMASCRACEPADHVFGAAIGHRERLNSDSPQKRNGESGRPSGCRFPAAGASAGARLSTRHSRGRTSMRSLKFCYCC